MKITEKQLILFFVFLHLIIHLLTNTKYGFHRDEFLYLEMGKHLAWGYMEVPPFIAILGVVAKFLGSSLFVVRLFPTLAGAIVIFLIGKLVYDLGGKKWAIVIACSGYLLAAAYLRTNMLFQPVSFNQMFWFLTAYLSIQLVRTENPNYWYAIGLSIGIGVLTKYSIVFLIVGLFFGLVLSSHRKWLKTRYPYQAGLLSFAIVLPNLLWQYNHNYPILTHMRELKETQLIHVEPLGFALGQLLNLSVSNWIWMAGLLLIFLDRRFKKYRYIGIAFITVLVLIAYFSGKDYYTLGAYPMLLVFGGIAIDQYIKKSWLKSVLLGISILASIPFMPYAIPVLSIEKMESYCTWMMDNLGFSGPNRWEDGRIYPLPQDYADMHGWEEMAQKVSKLYHSLPPETKDSCHIYGGSYSHAGTLNYYAKKYDLPEVHSMVGSFMFWAPEELHFTNQIMVDDVRHTSSTYFHSIPLVDSIEHQFAREPGYIYYRTDPKIDLAEGWKNFVTERKNDFTRSF